MRIGQKREDKRPEEVGAMARSPSRESVATDLSLMSLSSLGGGDSASRSLRVPVTVPAVVRDRGPSPCSDSETEERMRRAVSPVPMSASSLQLPGSCRRSVAVRVGETLFEEESELIRSCGLLSKALGLRRSFSTSDIAQDPACSLSSFASEVALSAAAAAATAAVVGAGLDMGLDLGQLAGDRRDLCERLDYASRSCSTWVAVGDMASASQLPSPQGREPQSGAAGSGLDPAPTPLFSAADLVRSMNKKVRQGYIKRRLLTTYKALQRMSQNNEEAQSASRARVSREILKLLRKDLDSQGVASSNLLGVAVTNLSLTAKDVEREKGKALTKYERNMMIFRWLHSLDDVPPGVTLDLLS